ncbi:MAG: hypothetical protein AAF990_01590 [Bacteroidota bacterium]
MYATKYVVTGLFVSILSFMGFQGLQTQPSATKSFVAEIKTAELLTYFADEVTEMSQVELIRLYQSDDQLIYELDGLNTNGAAMTKEAVVDKALLGPDFDHQTTAPCGCEKWGKAWKSGPSYECSDVCEKKE